MDTSDPWEFEHAHLGQLRVQRTPIGWVALPMSRDDWRERLIKFLTFVVGPGLIRMQHLSVYLIVYGDTCDGGILGTLPGLATSGSRLSVSPIERPSGPGFIDVCIVVKLEQSGQESCNSQALLCYYDEAFLVCTERSEISASEAMDCIGADNVGEEIAARFETSLAVAIELGGSELVIKSNRLEFDRLLGMPRDEL